MAKRTNDPWREMAIEKQFLPLVADDAEAGYPATLTYYQREMREFTQSSFYELDWAEDFLFNSLWLDRYANALRAILWPEEDLEGAMVLTLDDPDTLIIEAGSFAMMHQ